MKLGVDYPIHKATLQRLNILLATPSHGYVFYGPRYLYKRRTAEAIACILANTQNPNHPNITIVSVEEKAKSIKIAQIQQVIDQLSRLSFDDIYYRVIIIESAHLLTQDASNALLKILEEPGERIVFILITERMGNLLPTVRSRLQPISFVPPIHKQTANDLLGGILASRPRLEELINQDAKVAENLQSTIRMIEVFLSGSITQRFSIAKQIAELDDHTLFIELFEEIIRSGLYGRNGDRVVAMQDRMQHNINTRLCLEMFALESVI